MHLRKNSSTWTDIDGFVVRKAGNIVVIGAEEPMDDVGLPPFPAGEIDVALLVTAFKVFLGTTRIVSVAVLALETSEICDVVAAFGVDFRLVSVCVPLVKGLEHFSQTPP